MAEERAPHKLKYTDLLRIVENADQEESRFAICILCDLYSSLPAVTPTDIGKKLIAILSGGPTAVAVEVLDLFDRTIQANIITKQYCRNLAVRRFGPKTKMFL